MINHDSPGFTLLETIIYLAIFTVASVTMASITYGILHAVFDTQRRMFITDEKNFVTAKLNWVLSGTSAITVQSTTTLSAITGRQSVTIYFGNNHVHVQGVPVNNDEVPVVLSALAIIPAQGNKPSGVKMDFLVAGEPVTNINYALP